MKSLLIIILLFLICDLYSQSLGDLEAKREKAIADIEYVDNLLKETASERSSGLQSLNIVNSKLRLRENIILGIKEQVDLLTLRIELNKEAIDLMESDLSRLVLEYEKAILHAQKASKGQPDFAYVFSARDLNQGYKRLRYLQQVAKYRRREAELIIDLKKEIERNKLNQEEDLENIVELRQKEEAQRSNLQREQRSKRNLINRLSSKQRQLQQELRKKQRIATELEKEIERVIEEERKRRESIELTPEEKLVGDDFSKNMGVLPWPVERGVITSGFGVQDHPVFKGTKVDNIGVEITCGRQQKARTVFNGDVVSVFGISGGNMAVIIRHGKYLTVYQNLVNVLVKPGDSVNTKQIIGDIFSDPEEPGKSLLKFMIYEEKEKKNPEEWLSRKR